LTDAQFGTNTQQLEDLNAAMVGKPFDHSLQTLGTRAGPPDNASGCLHCRPRITHLPPPVENIPRFLGMLECVRDCVPGRHVEISDADRGYERSGGGKGGGEA
jgi:hypothetical protein